jgi:hypothetical protein
MTEKQETPRITVSNYTKIWNLDWVVYALEGKKLPVPANLRVIGIFVVCELIFYILGNTILFFLPKSYTIFLLPIGATWLIAKQKLDGKTPHKWLIGIIQYWMRPKRLHRYRKFEHNKHYTYGSKVIYRTRRERA